MKKSKLVPFEFLPEKAEGKAGGYLSTELQERTESFEVSPREK